MPKELILLVDNNVDYVKTLAEYIEQADYRVVKAYSAEDARNYAGQLHPDLAVIDVRLVNDDDEGDRTGVFLAKTLRETCPVIMLTNHATYELVRQTLKLDEHDRSLAVDFMDKHEGPAELIQTVQRVLAKPGKIKHHSFRKKNFWRTFRISAFIILCIPILIAIILVLKDNDLGLIMGLIFGGLQILVGAASWLFERRS